MQAAVEVVWATVPAGHLGDATRAALQADVDDARLAKLRRFHRPQDADRGLAAHALLRRELAALVGGHPKAIELRTRCATCESTDHGKPYLPGAPVEFNLSHSGDLVCLALAPAGVPVGVDVEQLRPVDWTALRRSVFGDSEWERAAAGPDPDAARAQVWARKEAAVKASGHGLALPLRRVELSGDAEAGDTAGRIWSATLGDGPATAAGRDVRFEASDPAWPGPVPPHAAAVAVLAQDGAGIEAIALRHAGLN